MSNNSQKTPLARSLNKFAEMKVGDAFQRAGQALPCTVVSVDGAIITVRFEINSSFTLPNVTVPMFGAEYIRYPIKAGDKGCVFPADARLAGMSGIGGGVADLSQPGNLTALVFAPISNVEWSTVDAQAVTIYGPNGVVLRDTGNASNITLTPSGIAINAPHVTVTTSGAVTINASGDAVVNCANSKVTASGDADITASGEAKITGATITLDGPVQVNGTLTATGEVTGSGIPLSVHIHGGVLPGPSFTSTPIP